MLTIPKYLKEAKIQDEWDDTRKIETPKGDPELKSRLEKMSYRAIQAFACGSAEWIVYRFDKVTVTKAAWDFIEVAWAMVVDLRYGKGSESWNYYSETEQNWDGPKPPQKALVYLESAFYTDDGQEPSIPASKLSTMIESVLSDPAPYKKWSEQILKRLETLYPRDEDDLQGEIVPREALDPDFDYKPADREKLISSFISKLDLKKNPFLKK